MRFWSLSKPTIAAVHGPCLAGAFELALACDITIADETAFFGEPELKFGAGIVTMILPWITGPKQAKEIILNGLDNIPAAEAHRLGLVNRVVPAGTDVDAAMAMARHVAVIDPDLQAALDGRHSRPLIGLNISGLLANEANIASERFGLAGDYRVLVGQLLTRLLESSDAHIVLLPHVHAPAGHYESDLQAADAVLTSLPARVNAAARERVTVVRRTYDATVLKWIIAQTEWFCGSRMHSTIAALSSGVPACALAYSLKTRGVFASCGVSESSVDLRELSTSDALEAALRTWKHRRRTAKTLENTIPGVLQQCERQFDQVMGRLTMAWAA